MVCVIQYAARDMHPGDIILDWGSGCGHQGAWLEANYAVHIFGVDITQAVVDWANKNTFGTYCTADGTNLSFVEDRFFDGVFSCATLYHLPLAELRAVHGHKRMHTGNQEWGQDLHRLERKPYRRTAVTASKGQLLG